MSHISNASQFFKASRTKVSDFCGYQLALDGKVKIFRLSKLAKNQSYHSGLCGTFNWNQKDDFMTLDGDIELTANQFTRRFVDDSAVCPFENR